MPACDVNPYNAPEACERCVSTRNVGNALVGKPFPIKSFFNLTESDKKRIAETPKYFTNIKDLIELWFDNYDVGYAVASSIISILRDPDPKLDPKWVERFIISSLGVYLSMINYLKENPTDLVYSFNGRVAQTKAMLRACNLLGVKCLLHERGHSMYHYALFENTGIHNIKNTHRMIVDAWEKANPETREEIATNWFKSRIAGKALNWYSYLSNQTYDLPENWDETKQNVIICNSSEDEFAAIGTEWKNHLYESQFDGIVKIVRDSAANKNTHFYLRVHPNLAKTSSKQVDEIKTLSEPNLTVIPATSTMSTYKLVEKGNKVISFGSTMGVEATFLRKPSILAGRTFYSHLNGTYNVESHAELLELLQKDIDPKPLDQVLMYGHFFATFGMPFKYYKPDDFGSGKFLGVKVEFKRGLKYFFIKQLYHSKIFPALSQKLTLRRREKLINNYIK